MKKWLFLDDCNMFEGANPLADLLELPNNIDSKYLKKLELTHPGVFRQGGNWRYIMEQGNIQYKLLNSGKKSNYKEEDYDFEYKLISGNY